MNRTINLPYVDEFLLYLKTQNFSEETIYNYEEDLKQFDNFLVESSEQFENINKIKLMEFKAYLSSRDRKLPFTGVVASKKLGARSINRTLSCLRMYLRHLIEIDKPVPIPPDAVKMVKTDRKHGQVAELPDLIRLIECPEEFEKNPLIGLRLSLIHI